MAKRRRERPKPDDVTTPRPPRGHQPAANDDFADGWDEDERELDEIWEPPDEADDEEPEPEEGDFWLEPREDEP